MNRKKALLFAVLATAVLAALLVWMLVRQDEVPQDGPSGVDFPSGEPIFPARPSVPPISDPATSSPSVGVTVPDVCSGEESLIERNGCVSDLAAETRDASVCDVVVGSLAKAACMNGVVAKPIEMPKAPASYQDFLTEVYTSRQEPRPSSAVSSPGLVSELPDASEDPRLTADAFTERFTSGTELRVYALSQYQARPGETIYVYGTGFVYPNTLRVGSISIPDLRSEDGATLSFKAPSSSGEYEISVSNSKGTSGGNRPKLVVSDNPAPRPQITGATPSVVDVSGEVTLTGIGFAQNNTVSTTLGVIQNVSANGNSVRFRISDLPVVAQVKDLEEVKGKKLGVGVYIANENGFNADLFYFDVQF